MIWSLSFTFFIWASTSPAGKGIFPIFSSRLLTELILFLESPKNCSVLFVSSPSHSCFKSKLSSPLYLYFWACCLINQALLIPCCPAVLSQFQQYLGASDCQSGDKDSVTTCSWDYRVIQESSQLSEKRRSVLRRVLQTFFVEGFCVFFVNRIPVQIEVVNFAGWEWFKLTVVKYTID